VKLFVASKFQIFTYTTDSMPVFFCVAISAPNVSAIPTSSSITCSWSPANNNNVCPSASVFFDVCLLNSSNSIQGCYYSLSSSTTSAQFTSLPAYTLFTCQVTPRVNSSVYGQSTGITGYQNARTNVAVPFAPGSPQATNLSSSNAIAVSWQAPTPATGPITNYNVSYSLVNTVRNANTCQLAGTMITYGNVTATNVNNLCACGSYSIAVAASTPVGYGAWSSAVTGLTSATTPSSIAPITSTSTSTTASFYWQRDTTTCAVSYNVSISPSTLSVVTINSTYDGHNGGHIFVLFLTCFSICLRMLFFILLYFYSVLFLLYTRTCL
jgi:hypothetical protein